MTTDETPSEEITPAEQIQELRDQQTKTMLTVLATLSSIEGITLEQADWPYLDPEEEHQRHRAAVSFFVP